MTIKKAKLSYSDYAKGIRMLTSEEQLRLLGLISGNLRKKLKPRKAKHSIMELEGLGAEIWKGIDAQEYVRKERESWD
ncbi:MAG: hypothetical protein DRI57_31705 [Deltaproteobacteria bacterium]|nr:MAG: hypothetical protein DRI57_31705 [Deltaproteobacteria bacterium]